MNKPHRELSLRWLIILLSILGFTLVMIVFSMMNAQIDALKVAVQDRQAERVDSAKTEGRAEGYNQGAVDQHKQDVEDSKNPVLRGPRGPRGPRGKPAVVPVPFSIFKPSSWW